MDVERSFRIECQKAFRFLIDEYDCELLIEHGCHYKNKTTAIIVSLELEYPGLFVMFLKLVDGKVPKDPFNRGFYLEDLVTHRDPGDRCTYKPEDFENEQKVREILYTYAFLTKKHASDILRGDFRVFQDLEQIVRNRAARLKNAADEASPGGKLQ